MLNLTERLKSQNMDQGKATVAASMVEMTISKVRRLRSAERGEQRGAKRRCCMSSDDAELAATTLHEQLLGTRFARCCRSLLSLVAVARRCRSSLSLAAVANIVASLLASQVIVGILLMLFVMTLIEELKVNNSDENSLKQLYTVESMNLLSPANITMMVEEYFSQQPLCIYLKMRGIVYKDEWSSFDHQRAAELSYLFLPIDPPNHIDISSPGKWDAKVEAWYDAKETQNNVANVNTLTTSFVIGLLLGWMAMFHRNAAGFARRIALPLQQIGDDMSKVSR